MTLDLTDEQTAPLLKELDSLIAADRFPFSPRIQMLKAIRAKLRPEPIREPLPPVSITNRRELQHRDGGALVVRAGRHRTGANAEEP